MRVRGGSKRVAGAGGSFAAQSGPDPGAVARIIIIIDIDIDIVGVQSGSKRVVGAGLLRRNPGPIRAQLSLSLYSNYFYDSMRMLSFDIVVVVILS